MSLHGSDRNTQRTAVNVLDVDRGLARALSAEDLAQARRHAIAEVTEVGEGVHDPQALFWDQRGLVGLLVVDGMLIRRVALLDRTAAELVGSGAILRPWDDFGANAPMPVEVSWRVIKPLRVARLDRRFLATITHWPALIDVVSTRLTERAHTLAFVVAVHCLRHVHLRLLVLLWHLADRYGRVVPEGTKLPLALSHADLAELVGAARPSVSLALQQLADEGLVWRNTADRTWMLSREPPHELRDVRPRLEPGLKSTA